MLCQGASVLPWGEDVLPGRGTVKLYCPRCEEVYSCPVGHRASKLDGAFFGPYFAHAMVLAHPALQHRKDAARYIPRFFGFRVAGQAGRPSLEAGEQLVLAGGSSGGSGGAGSAAGAGGAGVGAGGGAGSGTRLLPFTSHYTGARPPEDDFVSEEDLAQSPSKRRRQT